MEDDRVRQVGGKVEFKIAGEGRFRPQTGGGGGGGGLDSGKIWYTFQGSWGRLFQQVGKPNVGG